MKKIKLFCLPYAGGSSTIFSNWPKYLDKAIELVPIELAGRGERLLDPLYNDFEEMVEDIVAIVKSNADGEYAIFGHSLCGFAAYDVFRKLKASNSLLPKHLFFSGVCVPHLVSIKKKYHDMGEEEFKEVIQKFGGTPPEFFEYPELLELFLPVMMNDFKLLETRVKTVDIEPLDQDITVFLGKEEALSPEQCDGWKRYSTKMVSIHYMEGGHFFLNHQQEKLIKIINNTIVS